MALGENIGYSALLTQNNSVLYQPINYGGQMIHIALMGDLSLRTDYIKPPVNLTITAPTDSGAFLNWTASPDTTVLGYFVYRADSLYGYYQRISSQISSTSFHDTMGANGLKFYMVRPEKLQTTPSGTYYNLGVGITDTATVTYPTVEVENKANRLAFNINIYPNPTLNYLNINVFSELSGIAELFIVNENGQILYSSNKQVKQGENKYSLNVTNLPSGSYQLVMHSNSKTYSKKWIKL